MEDIGEMKRCCFVYCNIEIEGKTLESTLWIPSFDDLKERTDGRLVTCYGDMFGKGEYATRTTVRETVFKVRPDIFSKGMIEAKLVCETIESEACFFLRRVGRAFQLISVSFDYEGRHFEGTSCGSIEKEFSALHDPEQRRKAMDWVANAAFSEAVRGLSKNVRIG